MPVRGLFVALAVIGCGGGDRSPPPPDFKPRVPTAGSASGPSGAPTLPRDVTGLLYYGLQPATVMLALGHLGNWEIPIDRPLDVPPGAHVKATAERATPELVAWANASSIELEVHCARGVPANLERVSCIDGADANLEGLAPLTELRALSFRVTSEVTDVGLARLPHFAKLETLELDFTGITGAGLAVLERFPHLTSLSLIATPVEDDALHYITALHDLTSLDLAATMIDDAGVAQLLALPKLTALGLSNIDLGDVTLASVAKMTQLEQLNLDGTKVTDAGLRRLASLPHLGFVDVSNTAVTAAGCAALDRAVGKAVCLRGPDPTPPSGPEHATIETVGDVQIIRLTPREGPLRDQLVRRRHEAGKRIFMVETTASWCRPCIAIEHSLHDPLIVDALAGVTLVRVDIDDFGDQFASADLPHGSVPWFALFNATQHRVDMIASDEWDDDTPENMAPVLRAFAHRTLTRRRHPLK